MSFRSRRAVLQFGLGAAVAGALPLGLRAQTPAATPSFDPQPGAWRRFEVTTRVSVADPQGVTQLWLPAPDLDTGFQRSLGDSWTGNAASAKLVSDPSQGVRLLHATFAADAPAPTLTFTSRVETRGRAVDWSKPAQTPEDRRALERWLQPTALHPVDGLVRTTALTATAGAATDVEKVRAIYDWVVTNCHRCAAAARGGSGSCCRAATSAASAPT